MNDLNAQQIVLLTLLVSFVTSIATGITTVSLLEQAPEPVTQTINRVVERTVERVVENDENNQPQEKIVETIIVKEEDLTIEAVEKNSQSLVRIFNKVGDLENFVTLGVVVSEDGDILVPANLINKNFNYFVQLGNSKFNLKTLIIGESYALLKISSDQDNLNFKKVILGNSQKLKLGQSVIALSGQDSNVVSTGIISSLKTMSGILNEQDVNSTTTPQENISVISASVDQDKIVYGSILLNLQGELVGFKSNITLKLNEFTPATEIISFLESDLVKNLSR